MYECAKRGWREKRHLRSKRRLRSARGKILYRPLATIYSKDRMTPFGEFAWVNNFLGGLWWGVWFCLSLSGVAAAQVVTEVVTKGKHLTNKLIIAWKWADVVLRQIPIISTIYESSYETFLWVWVSFVCTQHWVVTSVEMFPLPYDRTKNQGEVTDLIGAWRRESSILKRGDGWQRAWVFIPSRDYLIRYSIKGSALKHPFFVFYRRDEPAAFPPYPLQDYWRSPPNSPIESIVWSGTKTPVHPDILDIVMQTAGPHQDLSEWSWKRWQQCFPAIFSQPLVSLVCSSSERGDAVVASGEMTAAERRRLARLRQNADQNSANCIIITRANQAISAVQTNL